MAGGDLFRKEAFDKVSSPEELDTLMVVTSWRSWVLLTTTLFILASAILYGFLGRIPDLVPGKGMILEKGNIIAVQGDITMGMVYEIHAKDGDEVKKGALLVSVYRPDLEDNLEDIQLKLDLKKMEHKTLLKLEKDQLDRQRSDSENQIKEEEEVVKMAEVVLVQQEESLKNIEELYKQGLIPRADLIAADNGVNSAKSQLVNYHQTISSLKKTIFDLTITLQQKRLQREETITQLTSSVRKAENALQRGSTLHSPYDGRIIETEIAVGSHVNSGSTYFKLQNIEEEVEQGLTGLFFVNAEKAKKLKEEMKVQVFPGEVDRNEYGFLVGRIERVSEFPVSEQRLHFEFGDPQVARQMISKMGIPYEVIVRFTANKDTTSGYEWSSRKGPPVLLQPGTICESKYEVGYKRPISLVMSWVRTMLGDASDN